jgi:tagatose 1,6-diphosphate aldolase
VLEHAFRAGASGFLAGRAIWADAFAAYPDWAKVEAGLRGEALAYLSEIGAHGGARCGAVAPASVLG